MSRPGNGFGRPARPGPPVALHSKSRSARELDRQLALWSADLDLVAAEDGRR
jgi:hypothetical protein